LGGLANLWFERSIDGAVPLRAAFSLEDLHPWMGWIGIFQVIDRAPLRVKARLHGVHLVACTGLDITGQVLPDCLPKVSVQFMPAMAMALEHSLPVYETLEEPGRVRYARLVLPMSVEGGIADLLLTCTDVADLRPGARRGVGLSQLVAQHGGGMRRRVLARPEQPFARDLPPIDEAPAPGDNA
jgi:hypothetical protein